MEHKTYVSRVIDSERQDFLSKLPALFGDGNGYAQIIYSDPEVIEVGLFNVEGERLIMFELTDYNVVLNWVSSKSFIKPNIDAIHKLWIGTLKRLFEDYKSKYIAKQENFINSI